MLCQQIGGPEIPLCDVTKSQVACVADVKTVGRAQETESSEMQPVNHGEDSIFVFLSFLNS